MNPDTTYPALHAHLRRFFKGHRRSKYVFTEGPMHRLCPRFHVLRYAPGPRIGLHVYVSVGAWEADHCPHDQRLEFLALTAQPEKVAVEMLTMVAYYHRDRNLGLGHTFPLGYTWLMSECDHMLVSLPYPFGPDLEVCQMADERVRFLWLLPITAKEKAFRHEHGLEALEEHFEQSKLNHSSPVRRSVV